MNELATQQDFTFGPESRLTYDPRQGLYRYDVHSSRDLSSINAGTRLWFDGDHGTMFASDMPTGISVGNTLHALLTGLHRATIGALPYRIVSSIFGLTVVALCLSGVVIWWRKRRARIDADQRCLYSSPNRDQI